MSGVSVTFLEAEPILSRLRERAERLLAMNPEVTEVALFGSLVKGNYCPGSDADLLIVLRGDSRRFIDRQDEFAIHFSGVGVPVDVFPYTVEEVNLLKDGGVVKSALTDQVVLARRQGAPSISGPS